MNLLARFPNAQAAIFDLDGTLLDSGQLWIDVDRRFLAKYGHEYDPNLTSMIKTMTYIESAAYFQETFQLPLSQEAIMKEWDDMVDVEYRQRLQAKKGAEAFLRYLNAHGIHCCIATSCKRQHAQAALDRLNMSPYLDFMLTCQDYRINKNSPEIYRFCQQKLGKEASDCFVFEDLPSALKTAREAGFIAIGIFDRLEERQGVKEYSVAYAEDFSYFSED